MYSSGDYHNLAVDKTGLAYSLPSQLSVPGSLGMGPPRVSQVVCGKEHCMLLTEHGQVYTWGGGSRGQLGHGTLASEERPRSVHSEEITGSRRTFIIGAKVAIVWRFWALSSQL